MNAWKLVSIAGLLGCLVLAVLMHKMAERLPPVPPPTSVECSSDDIKYTQTRTIELESVQVRSQVDIFKPGACWWSDRPADDRAIYCNLTFTTRCAVPDDVPILVEVRP